LKLIGLKNNEMQKLMHILALSCLKATELVEKRTHLKLGFKERFQLKVHLMICGACKRYEKQSAFIEMNLLANNNDSNSDIAKFKSQIKMSIKNEGA
jgi:hypothetical protein